MTRKKSTGKEAQNRKLKRFNDLLSVVVILLSLYILLWPLLPDLLWWAGKANVTAVSPVETPSTSNNVRTPDVNTLVIPSIKMSEKINEGQDISALRNGSWRLPKTSTPDKGGNTVVVGHRFTYSGKAVFYLLDKIHVGDDITVYWQKEAYKYKVSKTLVVPANQISIEENTAEPLLTLYTCTPLWSFKDRLVIQAKPLEESQ